MSFRVLLHGFIDSDLAARAAYESVAEARGVEFAGWVARPRFKTLLPEVWFGSRSRLFDEPLPSGHWRVPLGVQSRLCLDDPLVDEHLRYLLDRERHFDNQYDVTQLRSEILCYAQEILDAAAADAFVLADVPHSALSYALFVAARERSMKTAYFRAGPAPYLFGFCEETRHSLFDFAQRGQVSDVPTSGLAARFVERLGGSYAVATPESMRHQLDTSTLSARARAVVRERPRELISREGWRKVGVNVHRGRLRSGYERLTRSGPLPENFVALFLHLQPERSTVPEGGTWAQQWVIAHAIASALPPGWKLLVREHPSTFLTGPRLVRNLESYDALLRIPRVELVSVMVDPFTLIDAARCVATVTGSVGLEAIARATPALVFGDATYLGCPGAIPISRPDQIAPALRSVEVEPPPRADAVVEYLEILERSSRIYTCTSHADDPRLALSSGAAYRGVVPRMLTHLQEVAGR